MSDLDSLSEPSAAQDPAERPRRRDRARAVAHRWWQRALALGVVVLGGLAAWGAHDLDVRARAARHDGSTWDDLDTWDDRVEDLAEETEDAAEAERRRLVEDLSVATLRLRGLRVPVRGVEPGALIDSFEDPRSGGRVHRALDIAAPEGTPVVAAIDGVITVKDEGGLGGRYVYQTDATGSFVFYYAHLERWPWLLGEGDRVEAGDVIGYVGTTGNAPAGAPHLHFAIYKVVPGSRGRGIPINPWRVLSPDAPPPPGPGEPVDDPAGDQAGEDEEASDDDESDRGSVVI